MPRNGSYLPVGVAIIMAAFVAARADGETQASRQSIEINIVGSFSGGATSATDSDRIPTLFFQNRAGTQRAQQDNVYPNIDWAVYGDDYELEYVFRIRSGGDPTAVRVQVVGATNVESSAGGGVVGSFEGGEVVQSRPIVVRQREGVRRQMVGDYRLGSGQETTVLVPPTMSDWSSVGGTSINVVPSGGQAGGPEYDFYVSKYEVTCAEYVRFLNDAQQHGDDARGANTYYDKRGNVWFSPDMKISRHEIIDLSDSPLVYDGNQPLGRRYQVTTNAAPDGGSYSNHPVGGVSWFGALKYCNWLTVISGRGENERCYTEGTNVTQWAPVTATNWSDGLFTPGQRAAWLRYKGFRLPMSWMGPDTAKTNLFNEYYKAAAWDGITNRYYGFGRDQHDSLDANSLAASAIRKTFSSLPVGYFDGDNSVGKRLSRANNNVYSLYDLSGNADEWLNDHGVEGDSRTRATAGGSWASSLPMVSRRRSVPPYTTDSGRGFRVTSSYMPPEILLIHILYRFYLPGETLPGQPPEEEVTVAVVPPEGEGGEGDVAVFRINVGSRLPDAERIRFRPIPYTPESTPTPVPPEEPGPQPVPPESPSGE